MNDETKTKTKTRTKADPIAEIRALNRKKVSVVPNWARDPVHRDHMKRLVRAALDFQKVGISMSLREASPTATNPAELEDDDLKILLAVGAHVRDVELIIKKAMKRFLKQSEIGLWLLDQPGLGAGWLGGFVLAEFPDIYDAGICLECGKYLRREADMSFTHPSPPERGDDEPSKERCQHDGQAMEEGTYRIHERKPSTFIRFAGLATVDGWACPICRYNLRYNSTKQAWGHPKYTHLPPGMTPCAHAGSFWKATNGDGIPRLKVKGVDFEALPIKCSDKVRAKEKRSYNSRLRAKLIGPMGVADAMIKAKHPKYHGEIYLGYKQRVAQRDPWRTKGWIDRMAKRAMMYRFVIDFYTTWRKSEGLPCRAPYEEQYLGITHHN